MIGRLIKGAAYVKAPLRTFVALHPFKALKLGAMYLVVKKALEMKQGRPVHGSAGH